MGAPAGPATEHLRLTNQFQDLALSPDGKKVAFAARGEIFAASAKDGGDAARVTMTAAPESAVAWSPDSRRIVYSSERAGPAQLIGLDQTPDLRFQPSCQFTDFCFRLLALGHLNFEVLYIVSALDTLKTQISLEEMP